MSAGVYGVFRGFFNADSSSFAELVVVTVWFFLCFYLLIYFFILTQNPQISNV